MALDDLPPELWARICVQLNRHDLAILARLNSNFRDTARYHLYEWITLRSDARSVIFTMRLLAHLPALAQRVSRLDIITHPSTHNGWFDTNILTNMSNLRTIRFSRFPCKTVRRYASLVLLLSQSCPQLTTFEVKDIEWPAASPLGKLGPIIFPMMSTIRWNGEIGTHGWCLSSDNTDPPKEATHSTCFQWSTHPFPQSQPSRSFSLPPMVSTKLCSVYHNSVCYIYNPSPSLPTRPPRIVHISPDFWSSTHPSVIFISQNEKASWRDRR